MSASVRDSYLIVNADDYGYFRCVSQGILDAAARGIVTATGVFANAAHFDEDAALLRECRGLDVGVHLNLTDGIPLTNALSRRLRRWSGRFQGKFRAAAALLSKAITPEDVAVEWRAQIERCLRYGLGVRFLNSHEHVHLLPPLFGVATALAREYDIAHVRFPTAQCAWTSSASLFRSAVIKTLNAVNVRRTERPAADFLGMEISGKLDLDYLERTLPRLHPGRVHELMCHPGHFDAEEVTDRRLLRYHDWEGELRTLTSPAVRELLDHCGVRLIGYRDLQVRDNRLVVGHEMV